MDELHHVYAQCKLAFTPAHTTPHCQLLDISHNGLIESTLRRPAGLYLAKEVLDAESVVHNRVVDLRTVTLALILVHRLRDAMTEVSTRHELHNQAWGP